MVAEGVSAFDFFAGNRAPSSGPIYLNARKLLVLFGALSPAFIDTRQHPHDICGMINGSRQRTWAMRLKS